MNKEVKDKIDDMYYEYIDDIIYQVTCNFNDKELDYAINCMLFWKKERERQNKEIEESESE